MAEVFYYDYVTIKPWTYFLTASEFGLTYVGLKGDETVSPIFSFYPHRMLVRDPKKLAPYVQQLKEYFAGTRKIFDVPLDISEFGTEFQRRALSVVEHIPYGSTITYGDVATSLPDATSSRSVAHAVALNPVLMFIPDHRVILSNDRVGTYRLGQKEKIRLIELEKSHLHDNS
ncbi:methylated-DNA--[protein]-cysteine S-methyltransferase [Lactobacillus kefiranofaciens]|uniref:Methylated-DNA--[protein]-cysteine S-methyltransferase n=1 Tax=Lactobacillus kefiranofaciens TaxID=267818 RepID=A0AAX3UBZ6_9LACO|nr:methylated-DNA--[protein]-cysteine S-methyltransferase [Lactobacillus kefiranofaciens]AEG41368.1 possible methylated-DNA--[protein]-cysteine S-methyltransferase [Lactobacillus kefiranofaciens subsp. kefiranofaciens]KRL30053.1 methylated-DNA--[protein]-cysteine S-methyltransferase [Lactobacillus kefiranofaciens subsp. kefirgranum DSM 10550 = JCM 8572]KRM21245.1 methylated-DNA--[protein]-cysteine S-methyltransferase [Lactobacillus kefiranofaciens subsp. kefiranofaciens DSM 5016 = JCM 6985]MCJ2